MAKPVFIFARRCSCIWETLTSLLDENTVKTFIVVFRNGGKNWQKIERSCWVEVTKTKRKTKRQPTRKKRRRKRKKRCEISNIKHLNDLTPKCIDSLWFFICVLEKKEREEEIQQGEERPPVVWWPAVTHTHTHSARPLSLYLILLLSCSSFQTSKYCQV